MSLLQPDLPEAHANLASAYKDAARHDAAIVSYRRALELRSDFPEAFANLVHSLQVCRAIREGASPVLIKPSPSLCCSVYVSGPIALSVSNA